MKNKGQSQLKRILPPLLYSQIVFLSWHYLKAYNSLELCCTVFFLKLLENTDFDIIYLYFSYK